MKTDNLQNHQDKDQMMHNFWKYGISYIHVLHWEIKLEKYIR